MRLPGKLAPVRANTVSKFLIYAVFAAMVLALHLPLPYYGDDESLIYLTGMRSIPEQFVVLFHYNGKIFTDLFAFVLCHLPYLVWKIFNTGVFVLCAAMLVRLFATDSVSDVAAACALVLLFPFYYLGTAGWISTCANYLYPFAGLLFIALQMKSICYRNCRKTLRLLLMVPVMAYVLNQDQAAMILVGGLFLFLLYVWKIRPHSKAVVVTVAGCFLVALVGYVVMFCLPGHLNRIHDPLEMELYLPDYANWSIWKKLYRGYTSTVANMFFYDAEVLVLFTFLLFLCTYQQASLLQKCIAAFPLAGFAGIYLLGKNAFMHTPYGMPELYSLSTLAGVAGVLLTGLSLLCIVSTICTGIRSRNKWFLLGLLILGAGSRLMMCFSATLYASSYRTYTYLVFALIAGCILLLKEYAEAKRCDLRQTSVCCILLVLLLKAFA